MLYDSFPCKIMATGSTYGHFYMAFPLNKNSSYIKLFSYHIRRIKESGLETQWSAIKWRSHMPCNSEEDEVFRPSSYKNVISAFVVFGVGCIIASIYCFIEWTHNWYFNRQPNEEQNVDETMITSLNIVMSNFRRKTMKD